MTDHRANAHAIIQQTSAIEADLDFVPHTYAKRIVKRLEEIRVVAGDVFPGGFWGACPWCEEPKGEEEVSHSGDEVICIQCLEAENQEAVEAQEADDDAA